MSIEPIVMDFEKTVQRVVKENLQMVPFGSGGMAVVLYTATTKNGSAAEVVNTSTYVVELAPVQKKLSKLSRVKSDYPAQYILNSFFSNDWYYIPPEIYTEVTTTLGSRYDPNKLKNYLYYGSTEKADKVPKNHDAEVLEAIYLDACYNSGKYIYRFDSYDNVLYDAHGKPVPLLMRSEDFTNDEFHLKEMVAYLRTKDNVIFPEKESYGRPPMGDEYPEISSIFHMNTEPSKNRFYETSFYVLLTPELYQGMLNAKKKKGYFDAKGYLENVMGLKEFRYHDRYGIDDW